MADLIMMPKLGFDMAEGTLVEWTRKEGDAVAEGDVIATIETDKANVEVTSFKAGVIRQFLVKAGTAVPVNTPIAVIGAADEAIDLAALGVQTATPKTEKTATPTAPTTAGAPVVVASVGRTGPVIASPVARRMADELGIDLQQVAGSGPEGRIVKRDIEEAVKQRAQAPQVVPAPLPIPTPSYTPTTEEFHVGALTPMRQAIARRMTESKAPVPHFYVTVQVDMQAALDLRQQLNALLPQEQAISVNDLIVKAAALTLKQFPNINASFTGDGLRIHNRVNIGIAVARETGLVTTVLRDADRKSLAQIAQESREIVARAREGKMRAEELVGGTFNVSNLGMYGVDEFSAIITPPQAAALAVSAAQRAPVVNADGQIVAGLRMKATLSADHRVTEGVEVASFLQAFKAALEQPLRLVM